MGEYGISMNGSTGREAALERLWATTPPYHMAILVWARRASLASDSVASAPLHSTIACCPAYCPAHSKFPFPVN